MKQTKVETYTAQIYTGLQVGYSDAIHSIEEVEHICEKYVQCGLCVTVTQTKFFYVNGNEDGAIIGLINYPRFPSSQLKIKKQALELARILLNELEQLKVSVVFPEETIMLEKDTK